MEHAFTDTLAANPADRTTRLVYADWLEEHGREAEASFYCWLASLQQCRICQGYERPGLIIPPNPLCPFIPDEHRQRIARVNLNASLTQNLGWMLCVGAPDQELRRFLLYVENKTPSNRPFPWLVQIPMQIQYDLPLWFAAYHMARIIQSRRRRPFGGEWHGVKKRALARARKLLPSRPLV